MLRIECLTRRSVPALLYPTTCAQKPLTPLLRFNPPATVLPLLNIVAFRYAGQVRSQTTRAVDHGQIRVKVPQMAESISEGTIQSLSRNIGDYVNQDEEIASVETDKIDVAVNAPASGTIESILVRMGDTVNVGQDVAILRQGASPPSVEESTPSTNSVPPQRTTQDSDPKASSATISFPSDQQSPLQKLSGTSVERASSLEPILRTEESQRQSQNSSTQDSPSHGEGIHRGEYRVASDFQDLRSSR